MKPIANYNLYVTQKDHGNMNVRVVGIDTTDAQGYFDIVCPELLTTPIKIEHRFGEHVNWIRTDVGLDRDVRKFDDGYDFATIYYRGSFGSNVRIEIADDHPVSDSLYVGLPLGPVVVHPMNKGIYTVYVGFDRLGGGTSDTAYSSYTFGFYWGVGKKDYDSARNFTVTHRKDEPQYNLITTKCYPCAPSNTSLLVP